MRVGKIDSVLRRLSSVVLLATALACDSTEAPKHRAVPITLEQMLKTYHQNTSRADSEYGGRVFEFSAEAREVDHDAEGRPRLTFVSTIETGGAICTAAQEDPRLAAVKVGSTVKVRGTVVGIKSGSSMVVLSHCQLVMEPAR
jgi:hypothetical protein